MILCVDIGNTNIVHAIWNDDTFTSLTRLETKKTSIEINESISHVAISSVVPSLTNYYQNYFKDKFNINSFIVNHENCNINLEVDNPSEVGPDRICNAYGAKEKYGVPCLIIDFGSATTYDAVNTYGNFIGGAIAPGIDVSANYLIKKAALLNNVAFQFPNKVIGKDTKTNLQSGIMYGGLESVSGMILRIKDELQINNLKIVLTGGFSSLISSKMEHNHILDQTITLYGLQLISKKN